MTIDVLGLGYLGLVGPQLDGWRTFMTEMLGMTITERSNDDRLFVQMDDRAHRFIIERAEKDGLAFAGWELRNRAAVDEARAELAGAGVDCEVGTADECAVRAVDAFVTCRDPGGNRVELFCGAAHATTPFHSPAVSGFVTGDGGLGHLVLTMPDLEAGVDFYTRVLGFKLSDRIEFGGVPLRFFHCNPRHHSLALAGLGRSSRLAHFMVEVASLDDVGYGLDRLHRLGIPLAQSLGRHINDHMVSFYGVTPGRFEFEFGCQGRRIEDDASWEVADYDRGSFWGHQPVPRS